MPLDTSIPLQFQATQAANPMAIYNAMQEQRYNALRGQALEQEMIKNALIMQNSQEDRARAAQERAVAAANAAKYRGIINQFGVTPAVTGQRGVSYSGTGVSNDPYAAILPDLVRGGFIEPAKELSELKNKGLTGEKLSAETAGVLSENQKKKVEAVDAQLKQLSTNLERVSSVPEVFALFDGNADAIRATGKTPEMSKQAFVDLVGKVGFQQAIMQVSQGVMKTQEHINTIITSQKPEIMTDANGNLISANPYTATATPFKMAAPAGAPAAGAPAAAGEPVKATPKGGLTENQKMQLKARTSDDFGMATETLRYVQDIERDIKSLTDADIGGATGYQSYLPSFKENTIRAEKTLTELRDKVGALGRTLASMSGKLGNLAVQEYEFLRQQVALIDPTAGEKDVKRQLAKAETSMKRIANTVRDRYSREYGGEDNPFTQFRELPKEVGADTKTGTAAGAAEVSTGDPEIDALFNKYGK